ncbi:hypothetical protein SAMN05444412_11684 [Rhodonellum ikkaensis]|uniref:Uncharacterized protein n=1 Tax=Rhodonellum ikkaensis TaxID=336829 RepID=A0A1H3TEW0_9BACT|nr:hypothetical protein SAMN05444412_11684 [Rhodonellum ikkaensis]
MALPKAVPILPRSLKVPMIMNYKFTAHFYKSSIFKVTKLQSFCAVQYYILTVH